MLGWFQALMPKETRFFDLFERHAAMTLEGAKALRALLDGGAKMADHAEAVIAFEQQADEVTREIGQALRRSFITPFDRGDIHGLINDMDDAIDQMRQAVKAIRLFDVETFEPNMVLIGDLAVESAKAMLEAMPLLRAMQANAPRVGAACEKIISLEEESDQLYILGLKELYLRYKDEHPMGYIVGSEIFDHLEKVVDCFEDVAHRINGIMLEHL